jgi:TatD DNase family protein
VLTDTHCHLDFEKFDPDRAEVLARARQAGVERILIPGLNLASSRAAIRLAESQPMLFAAVGVHPNEAGDLPADWLEDLRALAGHARVKAIGEIGLDYYWESVPAERQKQTLKQQLDLAGQLHLPVVLHFRDRGDAVDGACAQDLLAMLEAWLLPLRQAERQAWEHPGVLHAFAGSLALAQRAIRLGFHIGVGGRVTRSKRTRLLVSQLSLASLVLETDAPFQTPAPPGAGRNEPANIGLIADTIASLHSCGLEEVAAKTTENARDLFRWEE